MWKKYSISSFFILVIVITYLFTIFNSRVPGVLGDLTSMVPLFIVLFLSILSIVLSIISWRKGGNKLVASILIFLAFSPIVLFLIASVAGGGH